MKILGIETSCDETAISIIEYFQDSKFKILAEQISSQIEVHQKYGGVVPEVAAREHMRNLPLVLDCALKQSGVSLSEIDRIAVTVGPGLKGCLLMGFHFAQALAFAQGIDLIPVNHIEGHLVAPFLDNTDLSFPFLSLIVSGGHTELLLANSFGDYKVLARTLDDAAGEAFDKSAHLLGIAYPGGPALAKLADQVDQSRFSLPAVMQESDDFSFSGLKTAIALLIRQQERNMDSEVKAELAFAIQDSIVSSLVSKLKKAILNSGVKSICLTGGVAANKYLRQKILEIDGSSVYFPSFSHCTDNASMIVHAGKFQVDNNLIPEQQSVVPRWPIERIREEQK
ncbi:MAG: tRNA (adenosine(37)-N6)-threonylcarbamoyltransferase complex transferase subunit TsaD [Deltaproteobacteria bacterium]|nr:tRNA (adenosine(37)-N6)-threonylcarbamoyltransferase complex transferase subunit TsaD [Deltaproteobacteria bacterium]